MLVICGCTIFAATGWAGVNSLYEGIQLFFAGKYYSCIDELLKVIESPEAPDPDKAEAYTFAGAAYYRLKDEAHAGEMFERCLRLDPSYTIGIDFTQDIRNFFLDLKERYVVSMTIVSQPERAEVFVNGDHVGNTPYSRDLVFVGDSYDVRLVFDPCYQEISSRITIEEGKPVVYEYTAERMHCALNVSTNPMDASRELYDNDGQRLTWADSIPCGSAYKIRLFREGYHDSVVDVDCRLPGAKNISVSLDNISIAGGGILKYITTAGCIASFGMFLQLDKNAYDDYVEYLNATYPPAIPSRWDDYERARKSRDLAGWTTTGLGAISAYLWIRYIFAPRHAEPADIAAPSYSELIIPFVQFDAGEERFMITLSRRF